MGKEIERKFLTVSNAWRSGATGVPYVQGYISADKGRTVRVRIAGDEGYLTIKGPTEGLARDEFEYKIPSSDAREILDKICLPGLVEKMRYRVSFGGLIWEVDEFMGANQNLVVAEVELPSVDHPVTLPPWVGAEVSQDSRYTNAALAQKPYSQWK